MLDHAEKAERRECSYRSHQQSGGRCPRKSPTRSEQAAGATERSRKSEGNVDSAGWRLEVFAASSGNHDILAAIYFVRDRRCVACERKRRLPQELARRFVESAEFLVEVSCPDKQEAASSDNRSTVIFAPGVCHTFGGKLGVFAERNLPDVLTGVEIDGIQRSARRSDGGISVEVIKSPISGESVAHGDEWLAADKLLTLAAHQKVDECGELILSEVRKPLHSSLPVLDRSGDLRRPETISDV